MQRTSAIQVKRKIHEIAHGSLSTVVSVKVFLHYHYLSYQAFRPFSSDILNTAFLSLLE